MASSSVEGEPAGTIHAWVQPGDSVVEIEWTVDWVQYPAYCENCTWGYHVYRGTSPDQMLLYSTLDYGPFKDTSVKNNRTYYYRLVAFDKDGEGAAVSMSATPRPGPINVQYSPKGVGDCEGFNLRITWDMPQSEMANVTAFRLYSGYAIALTVDKNFTNATVVDGGGWGPHLFHLSAVFSDGSESYASTIYVDGPMCEGVVFCPYELFFLVAIIVVVIAVILAAVLYVRGRKK